MWTSLAGEWREGLFILLGITSYIKTQYKFNARQSKFARLAKTNEFIKSAKVMVENCWNCRAKLLMNHNSAEREGYFIYTLFEEKCKISRGNNS